MKVFVVGGNRWDDAARMVSWIKGAVQHPTMQGADLVVFTGGADVTPGFYREARGSKTSCDVRRDLEEMAAFEKAKNFNIPILGICRGSQLSCVMSKGRLVQHQDNPLYVHPITTYDGQELMITSTHHQAQYPYELPEDEYTLIGWTDDISRYHLNGMNLEISDTKFKEAEIVYYSKTNALGIQGHPEYPEMKKHPETLKWINDLIIKLLDKQL